MYFEFKAKTLLLFSIITKFESMLFQKNLKFFSILMLVCGTILCSCVNTPKAPDPLAPKLQIIDLTGKPILPEPVVVIISNEVRVQGQSFIPTASVRLFLDSLGGQPLKNVKASGGGEIQTSFIWPPVAIGKHLIFANDGVKEAKLEVSVEELK